MEFVDIAGLVAGASKGEGLGNQFLSHIREVDAIGTSFAVLKTMTWCMWMERSTPLPTSKPSKPSCFSPIWTRRDAPLNGQPRMPKQVDAIWWRAKLLARLKEHLDAGQPARTFDIADDDPEVVKSMHLLTGKPVMYIANVDEEGLEGNALVDRSSHRCRAGR